MQIDRLAFRNFGSHESTELHLRDRGLILIEGENRDSGGSNGAGKSTLFEALCWGLFGQTNQGLRGDDVCRVGTKDTAVEIDINNDGQEVEIRRYRKHKEHGNNLYLRVDGNDITGATSRDTQILICQILRLDWSAFTSVVLFPQGKEGIAAGSDQEAKGVLDTVLALHRFRAAETKAKALLAEVEQEVAELEQKRRDIGSKKGAFTQTRNDLKAQKKEFEEGRAGRIEVLQRELERLDAIEPPVIQPLLDELGEKEAKLHEILAAKETQQHAIDQARVKYDEARSLHTQWSIKLSGLRGKLSAISVPDVEAQMEAAQTCPACDRLLDEEDRDALRRSFEREAAEAIQNKQDLSEDCKALEAKVAEEEERMSILEQKLNEASSVYIDSSELEAEIAALKLQLQHREQEFQRLKAQVAEVERELAKAETEENPYGKLVDQVELQISKAVQEHADVLRDLELPAQRRRDLLYWVKGFSHKGVKNLLLARVTPFLNIRANVYMKELSRSNAWVEIKTQTKLKSGAVREKMSFAVHYPGGSEKYKGKSGGERKRADIAILFALGDLAASRSVAPVHLRLLDEPFDSLDGPGCEAVIGLLHKHIVPRAGTVLVISHSEVLKPLFETRWKVIKERGVSRIEEIRA